MSWRSVCVLLLFSAHTQAAEFIPLGDLPGGGFSSEALGVDSSGSTVVGSSAASAESDAFKWTSNEGMLSIASGGYAAAISGDGSTIVGSSKPSGGDAIRAFRWSQDEGLIYFTFPGTDVPLGHSYATDISFDGKIITGAVDRDGRREAYAWSMDYGFIELGNLFSEEVNSSATAISADGNVVVGQSNTSGQSKAFRWNAQDGMTELGDLPGGASSSSALNISADGTVIAGYSDSSAGIEAFRRTESDGMVGLGYLPGSAIESYATAATSTGKAIVGLSGVTGPPLGTSAFVWTEAGGIRSLQFVLETKFNLAMPLAGWHLNAALDISADGKSIVGRGINPDGNTEAWLVRLDRPIFVPEPSTVFLAALSLAGMLCYHRRRSV